MIDPTFTIGSLTISWYGVIIALAIASSYLVAQAKAKQFGLTKEIVDEAVLVIVPAGIVGARLYHVLDFWDFYRQNPSQIFFIWQGGIGILGALIFGFLVAIFYLKIKKLPILASLDLLAIAVILGQAIGRLANFVNLEGFGPPTNLPWKIFVPGEKRPLQFLDNSFFHPTFFYEAIASFFGFFLLLFLAKKLGKKSAGLVFASYLVFYGIERFFLEFLRIDTWTIDSIKVAQILSLLMVGTGTILIFLRREKKKNLTLI